MFPEVDQPDRCLDGIEHRFLQVLRLPCRRHYQPVMIRVLMMVEQGHPLYIVEAAEDLFDLRLISAFTKIGDRLNEF